MSAKAMILITGAAQRIGRSLARAVAQEGFDVALHYNRSHVEAQALADELKSLGRHVVLLRADLSQEAELMELCAEIAQLPTLVGLVNNAAIFEALNWQESTFENWNRHQMINVTAPFMLSQAFARAVGEKREGRIVNLLDWRSEKTDPLHLPYTVSKAALASVTKNLAVALAPYVTVNAIALGAILPPVGGSPTEHILTKVPMQRWASLDEVTQSLLFFLTGPTYVTGEILHLDGGRHLR